VHGPLSSTWICACCLRREYYERLRNPQSPSPTLSAFRDLASRREQPQRSFRHIANDAPMICMLGSGQRGRVPLDQMAPVDRVKTVW